MTTDNAPALLRKAWNALDTSNALLAQVELRHPDLSDDDREDLQIAQRHVGAAKTRIARITEFGSIGK